MCPLDRRPPEQAERPGDRRQGVEGIGLLAGLDLAQIGDAEPGPGAGTSPPAAGAGGGRRERPAGSRQDRLWTR